MYRTLMGLWLPMNQRDEIAKERLEINSTVREMEGFWAPGVGGPWPVLLLALPVNLLGPQFPYL